jgi:para-nitrobenzyl esterase
MPRMRNPAPVVITASALAVATATTAVAASTAATASTTNHARPRVERLVHTTGGIVRGFTTGGVRVFDGIPYAKAPVGNLRWHAPEPANSWSGVRAATRPGPDCVQTAVAWRAAAASTDEDCLYLNVWTPRGTHRRAALPVAVWFHGGGYVNGAGRDFRPVAMVREGRMIVVTVNYRLGAMGYLTLPQLDAANGGDSGNYGLLDQIQALRWVRANIARLGGDPGKVMIAGQSAGAESVCSLLASPSAAGLFTTAVVESGLACAGNPVADAQTKDAAFATALG